MLHSEGQHRAIFCDNNHCLPLFSVKTGRPPTSFSAPDRGRGQAPAGNPENQFTPDGFLDSLVKPEDDGVLSKMTGSNVVKMTTSRQQLTSNKVSLSDYNFQSPNTNLLTTTNTLQNKSFENFHYPGNYSDLETGTKQCQYRLEAGQVQAQQLSATTNHLQLHPGLKLNTGLITTIEHYATQQQYHNKFTAMPSTLPYRPQLISAPVMPGIQTAQVVASGARIKVQFIWDWRNNRSYWIRTNQYWSGKQWGLQFIPHKQQEVIIEFVNGQAHQPRIIASLYNGINLPPFELPQLDYCSGIKTLSNQLRFSDQNQSELIYIQTRNNFSTIINKDHQLKTKNQTITIQHGDQINTLLQNQSTISAKKILLQNKNSRLLIDNNGIHFDAERIELLCKP